MTTQIGSATQSGRPTTTDEILFIGTATLLIRYGGLTLLTDPNFIHAGEEIPLGYGLTTHRLTDPAMEIEDLPALDGVILSHFHADHFDRLAEERLPRSVPIVTNQQASDALTDRGFTATRPLETWQATEIVARGASCEIRSMPGKHAPSVLAVALPDVMGSLLELRRSGEEATPLRIYISGDTIIYEGVREIPEREPIVDLAFLHLGGTRVMGVTVTMDAEQGIEMLELLRPRLAIPIHYDDYEAFKSPLADFVAAVDEAGLDASVRYLARGERLPL